MRIIIYTHALESRCALCHYTYKFNRAWHFTPFAIADFVLQRSHWKSFAKFLRLVSFCKFYILILIRYSSGDQTCIECNNEAYTTIVDNLWIVEKQQKITNNIQIKRRYFNYSKYFYCILKVLKIWKKLWTFNVYAYHEIQAETISTLCLIINWTKTRMSRRTWHYCCHCV